MDDKNLSPAEVLFKHPVFLPVFVIVCLLLLPTLLNALGFDFGSTISLPENYQNSLGEDGLNDTTIEIKALEGKIYHSLLDWIAVCVAFIVPLLALFHFRRTGRIGVAVLGLTMFCVGVIDTYHVLASGEIIDSEASLHNLAPFTWAASRIFNAVLIIFTIGFNLWLIRSATIEDLSQKSTNTPYKYLGCAVAIYVVLTLILIIATQKSSSVPQTIFTNSLITRPFDVLPLALFILGATISWIWYRKGKSVVKLALLLSFLPQITAQLHMSFGSELLYDNHFIIGHLFKVLAYACIAGGILLDLLAYKPNSRSNINSPNKINNATEGQIEVGRASRPQAVILPAVVFVLSVTLTLIVGVTFYLDSSYLIKEQELGKLKSEVNVVEPIITNLYEEASADVRFLSRTPPIQGIISALKNNNNIDFELWEDRLKQIFSERLANHTEYRQIRFIGLEDNGREIINVSRVNGIIYPIPKSRLQQKGEYDYVKQTLLLLPNQVYFSKIEYNREFGKITIPFQPVLRVATPVFRPGTGEPFGLIIVNVDFVSFLSRIEALTTDELQIYIANEEGDYIYHPDENRRFAYELGQQFLMQTEFPEFEQAIKLNEREKVLENVEAPLNGNSELQATGNYTQLYKRISLERFGASRPLRLLLMVDNAKLDQSLINYRNRSIMLGLALAVIALVLAVIASRRLVTPLIQTTQALEYFERTGELQPLPIDSKDEIGVLARRFQNLLAHRQFQEKELADHRYATDQHTIIAVTDISGSITFVNNKFCEISGYSRDELLGQNHRIINSAYHPQEFFRNMYLAITKGEIWHGQICNRSKNGKNYWVDTTVVPIMDDEGKPKTYIAQRSDITEQKEVEIELIKAKDQADAAVLAKSEFLATMSHEIRTPMNGVLGMLNLLLDSSLSDEQHKRLDIAQSSAQSLLTLLNDILDFSKVEAGKMDVEIIDFDICKLMGEFSEASALRAHEKDLELILDISRLKYSHVKGDPGRLRQILTNLVGNAIKFTEEGEVLIEAEMTENADSSLSYCCKIIDTGIGIPENKLNAMFNSFTQVDASTTRRYGGTGLGLSIVKKLCELMHGDVLVSSELGKGSCFEIRIQLEKSDQKHTSIPDADFSKLKMLVVDDNATNRKVLSEQLRQWGAQVEVVGGAHDALGLFEEYVATNTPLFDFAFIDMQMPLMDGAELGRLMNENENTQTINMVMMTSASERGEAKRFADIGFSAYLPKPVSPADLFDTIAVIAEGGEALEQASPLITRHYLDSLSRRHNEPKMKEDRKWPSKTRLLIVEDNHINQEVAIGLLADMNLKADVAANGQEAITALKEAPDDAPYTLILMDCQMPIIDGFEATRLIGEGVAGTRNNSIPIIAMTANAMKGDKEKCLHSGMVDYISKPIDPGSLYRILCQWLISDSDADTDVKAIKIESDDMSGLKIWNKSSVLKRVGGKEERLHKLVGMFFDKMPDRILKLEEAVVDGNYDSVVSTAHEIKGVLGNLSAESMASVAAEVEHAGRSGDRYQLEEFMPAFMLGYKRLNTTLQDYLNSSRH